MRWRNESNLINLRRYFIDKRRKIIIVSTIYSSGSILIGKWTCVWMGRQILLDCFLWLWASGILNLIWWCILECFIQHIFRRKSRILRGMTTCCSKFWLTIRLLVKYILWAVESCLKTSLFIIGRSVILLLNRNLILSKALFNLFLLDLQIIFDSKHRCFSWVFVWINYHIFKRFFHLME